MVTHRYPWLTTWILALGCVPIDPPSSDGDSSTSSTSSISATSTASPTPTPTTTSVDTTATPVTESTDGPSGTSVDDGTTTDTGTTTDSTDTGSSSSSGEPIPAVTVEGEVLDFIINSPIAGAEISIYEDPAFTAISDISGQFSIDTVLSNTAAWFMVAPSVDYWGSVAAVDLGGGPLQTGVELPQLSREIIDLQMMILAPQMPAALDTSQAIVIARLLNATAVMEGNTTIEMIPAPAPDTYYAADPDGAPILNQDFIQFAVVPVVIYFNVPDTLPGDIVLSATHPTRVCTVPHPDFPTIGEHVTIVDVECLPP